MIPRYIDLSLDLPTASAVVRSLRCSARAHGDCTPSHALCNQVADTLEAALTQAVEEVRRDALVVPKPAGLYTKGTVVA